MPAPAPAPASPSLSHESDSDESDSDGTKAEIADWQEKSCPNCDVSMKLCPDEIDWSHVWRRLKEGDDSGESDDSSNEDSGHDPCDDCCCGSCGQRKRWPGESHC